MAKRTYDYTDLALMAKDIEYIKKQLSHIESKIENSYVTREEFKPVRTIVYGFVGLVLTSVVGALLGLVIIRGL